MRRGGRLGLALAVVAALGFASKLVGASAGDWVRYSAGGVLYEVFWILVLAVAWPRLSPLRAALAVFAVTCALEGLQLWHPPALEAVRATFLGRALIGSTFSWWDFPHYALGCALGAGLARALAPRAA